MLEWMWHGWAARVRRAKLRSRARARTQQRARLMRQCHLRLTGSVHSPTFDGPPKPPKTCRSATHFSLSYLHHLSVCTEPLVGQSGGARWSVAPARPASCGTSSMPDATLSSDLHWQSSICMHDGDAFAFVSRSIHCAISSLGFCVTQQQDCSQPSWMTGAEPAGATAAMTAGEKVQLQLRQHGA